MNRSAHRALHNYVFHFQERRKKERSVAARPAETVGLEDAVADRFQSRRSRLWRKEDRSRTAHETGKRIARRRHRPEDDASDSGSGAAEARPACAKYKTTTIGKLAHRLRQDGRSVVLAAGDTFRAAAIEQLGIWASRTGAEIIKTKSGGDPAAVVYDALTSARARNADVVIVDTAGRLHTKSNLMAELDKMKRTAAKIVPGAPHDVLLVMDATTGQNGLAQAREFTATAGVTGIVLTKLDGTAKGGIVVAITRELGLPVSYIGTGETMEDLVPFDAETFVSSLFD